MLARPWSTLFLDTFLNLLVLLFLMINPIAMLASAEPRAEYTLTMVWDQSPARLDEDIYVRMPDGRTAWYMAKDQGTVFIDRDHLGRDDKGPIRQEDVQFIAPVMPGVYLVSVHTFSGTPSGYASFELKDKKGNIVWSMKVETPPLHGEHPLVQLFFNQEGKLVSAVPSNITLRTRAQHGG